MSKRLRRTTAPQKNTALREVAVLLLAGVLAAVAMYSAYEPDSALGLIDSVYAQTPVLLTPSETAIISNTQALDLAVPRTALENDEKVQGTWFDPTNPPAVLHAQARNTRIGGQVLVTWEIPEGVDSVTVTRSVAGTAKLQKTILEESAQVSFVDTGLSDGLQVTYTIASHVVFEGETYTSVVPATVQVLVADTIAPVAPTQVTVTHVEETEGYSTEKGLVVTWVPSTDTDIEEVQLYRSTSLWNRGELLIVLEPDAVTYTDKTVEAHETYYYTVVAVDGSGNESSTDLDIPAVGNSNPFEPIGVVATEESESINEQ